jgi:ankyrin repeat protein
MSSSRHVKAKHENQVPSQEKIIPAQVFFWIGTFLGYLDVTSMAQVCKSTHLAMQNPRIWRAFLHYYFRAEANDGEYLKTFKSLHAETPKQKRQLVRLFKEGDLKGIQERKQVPFYCLDFEAHHYNLGQWVSINGHQNILNAAFTCSEIFSKDFDLKVFWAARYNQSARLDILLQQNNNVLKNEPSILRRSLLTASSHGHSVIVAKLINHKADINFPAHNGETALYHAVQFPHAATWQLILPNCSEATINIFQNEKNPLMAASKCGNLPAVAALLEAKAQVNDPIPNQHPTALHFAASGNHTDIVRLLIEKKAKINARTYPRRTPLFDAAEKGHLDVVKILVSHRAQVDAKTMYQETPLARAAFGGHDAVVDYLSQSGAKWEDVGDYVFKNDSKASQGTLKRVLLMEIDDHLSEAKESRCSKFFSRTSSIAALKELRAAIENNANKPQLDNLWDRYYFVFFREQYKNIFYRAVFLTVTPEQRQNFGWER